MNNEIYGTYYTNRVVNNIRASSDWLRVSPYPLASSAGQQRRPGPSQLQQGPGPVQIHRMFHEGVWLLGKAKKSAALCACFRYFGELRWWGIATLPCREDDNFKYIRRSTLCKRVVKEGTCTFAITNGVCTSVQERRYDGRHSADVAIFSEDGKLRAIVEVKYPHATKQGKLLAGGTVPDKFASGRTAAVSRTQAIHFVPCIRFASPASVPTKSHAILTVSSAPLPLK